jgi:ornithine decarboxylase
MKCNSHPTILKLLAEHGTGFNCSTTKDLNSALRLGCRPSDITLTHPFKTGDLLDLARASGVTKVSFDSLEELHMIRVRFPEAEMLLRVATYKKGPAGLLKSEFGVPPEQVRKHLHMAKNMNLQVAGISFHIEADPTHPDIFRGALLKAVEDSMEACAEAVKMGFMISIIDIGGGFSKLGFHETARVLARALSEHVPNGLAIIGEPGRLLVGSAVTIVCKVIALRSTQISDTQKVHARAYVNDSIYASFSNRMHDNIVLNPRMIAASEDLRETIESENTRQKTFTYDICGCTTNNTDILAESCSFDMKLAVNDWLIFSNMGGEKP